MQIYANDQVNIVTSEILVLITEERDFMQAE